MTAFADDLGKLILRLTIGVLMLMHGIPKVLGGVVAIKNLLAVHHLPAFLAYFVYVGEIIGPIMVLVGLYTRLGGLLIAIDLIVAIALAHGHQVFSMTSSGVWTLELEGLYLFGGLVIALIGAGRYSGGGKGGVLN